MATDHSASCAPQVRIFQQGGQKQALAWDQTDDSSTVPYKVPTGLVVFIAIPSAAGRVELRDNLRRTWLRRYEKQRTWDYGFFVAGAPTRAVSAEGAIPEAAPAMMGDIVRLPGIKDDYDHLASKVRLRLTCAAPKPPAHARCDPLQHALGAVAVWMAHLLRGGPCGSFRRCLRLSNGAPLT